MNYENLPPGRRRGIVYANNLLSRQRRRLLNTATPLSYIRPSSYILPTRIVPISPILSITRYTPPRIIQHTTYDDYIFLTQLQDVKIGLITKNLLKNSIVKLNENDNEFCVICQDDIDIDDIVRNINCSHTFHINCIDNWFVENKKCPTCKFELN
jgi:hypothetical protein